MKSKTGISLEISLNVSKYLIVSLVPLKFFDNSNLSIWRDLKFYCAPRKTRWTFLPEGTDIHIQQHNHQTDLNHRPPLLYHYGK